MLSVIPSFSPWFSARSNTIEMAFQDTFSWSVFCHPNHMVCPVKPLAFPDWIICSHTLFFLPCPNIHVDIVLSKVFANKEKKMIKQPGSTATLNNQLCKCLIYLKFGLSQEFFLEPKALLRKVGGIATLYSCLNSHPPTKLLVSNAPSYLNCLTY